MRLMLRFSKFYPILLGLLEMQIFTECSTLDEHIIGGYVPEKQTLAKYVVSIRFGHNNIYGSNHFCAGVVLNERTVITAAHCLYPFGNDSMISAGDIFIVAGSSQRYRKEATTQLKNVTKVIAHPDFRQSDFYADIGLLILKGKLKEDGETVQRIIFNDRNPEPGWKCTAIGWGNVYIFGPLSNKLLYVDLVLGNKKQCNKYWHMVNTIICAADFVSFESKGVCLGDSGGPLICEGNKFTGITSYVLYDCQHPKHPSFFTNAKMYYEWISMNCAETKQVSAVLLTLLSVLVPN